MKQTVGQIARKDKFFKRPDVRKQIVDNVGNGENLLISAPRRVGKTSILMDLIDTPELNTYTVFLNTEEFDNPEKFFKLALKEILKSDLINGFGRFSDRVKEFFANWSNRINEITIGEVGIGIRQREKPDFYEELVNFLTTINLEGKMILLLIDEFPFMLEHIKKKLGTDAVLHFLSQNRTLRQNPLFHEKIKFIYTGSIGVFNTIKKINGTDRINDLREIKIGALKKKDAEKFINELLQSKTGQTADKQIMDYILKKIEWWIPFYFQFLVSEINLENFNMDKTLSKKMIDKAFKEMTGEKGNVYFQHFKSRLSKSFTTKHEIEFITEFLLLLKKKEKIDFSLALNLAVKFGVNDKLDDMLEILKHDGYIAESKGYYKFYSPILKTWWK